MARTTNRAGGHQITPAPRPAGNIARPASSSDPGKGPAHPTSRKPAGQGGSANGHGGGSK